MKKIYTSPNLDISEITDVITASFLITFDGKETPFIQNGGTPKIDGKGTDFNW